MNYTNIILNENRCQTPMSNYTKIFNNKLSSIPRCDKKVIKKRENNILINNNCLTNVERKKYNNKLIEEINKQERQEDLIEIKNHCNTIEISNKNTSYNSYIYNKPNIIIKKYNSLSGNNNNCKTIERPGSAARIYKRAQAIKSNEGLFLYDVPISISNSFDTENNKNDCCLNYKNRIGKIVINSPIVMNKRKMNQEKEGHNVLNKLNKYFSYNKGNNNNNNENKYMKKINIKSYKQKLKALQNDNFYEKRERYGKIYEREKKEEKERNKKKMGNEILLTNKSNEFLKNIKPLNTRENQILNCYLSPKNNKSQIFNNFYSFNLPAPVKVINVFKK